MPRRLARTLLALSTIGVAGCGTPPSTPPAPKPPTVEVLPQAREVLATSLKVTVQATGCDTVQTIRVYDHDQKIAEGPATGGTTTLDIPAKAIDFKARGISADLALYGEAVCANGLSAKSNEAPVIFMPVAEVLPGPWPFNNFWMDSDGSFLACTNGLAKYGKDGKQIGASLPLLFDCAGVDVAFASDGKRYAWKPGSGIVGFTSGMKELFAVNEDGVAGVFAPASGDVLAVDYNQVHYSLFSYDRATGKESWSQGTGGQPAGKPFRDRLGRVVYPTLTFATGSTTGDLGIERYDSATGTLSGTFTFAKVPSNVVDTTVFPSLSFDATGDTVYFADLKDPGSITACEAISGSNANPKPCTTSGGGLKWRSPALNGGVVSAVRTSSALVAIGKKAAYFLNPTTGAVVGQAVLPTGSLEFSYVLGGADGSTTLLAQAPDQGGIREVVLFDTPGSEAARFTSGGTGYVVDLDPSGAPVLLGTDIVKLLPAGEYRKAR